MPPLRFSMNMNILPEKNRLPTRATKTVQTMRTARPLFEKLDTTRQIRGCGCGK